MHRNPRFALYGVVLAAAVVAVPAAQASLMLPMDLDTLAAEADRIVVAQVLSVRGEWDSTHRRILSRIELQVEEAWKGEVGSDGRLTIVQAGGSVGDLEMTVHGMPRFRAGEKAVLFLAGGIRAAVLGMAQGKRAVRWDSGAKRWMAFAAQRVGLAAGGGRAANAAVPLDELRRQVKALVKR